MSNTGEVHALNDKRAQALQAILNSLSPDTPASTHDADTNATLSSDQILKISKKLDEMLGDAALPDDATRRNEKGELVNEDGLPIVDITEPLPAVGLVSPAEPAGIFNDPDLLPPWALSADEQARRRAERERILDLLEEEERLEEDREAAVERDRRKYELERRKEAAKAELESLRKAKEMQKKMGKALLRNVTEARERQEKLKAVQEKQDEATKAERRTLTTKKSVSFADISAELSEDEATDEKKHKLDWGDVVPGRLRKGRTTLMTKEQFDKQPMKMEVVERRPGGAPIRTSSEPIITNSVDSDDESISGSPVPADSDEGGIILSDHYDYHEELPSSKSGSGSDIDGSDHEDEEQWREDEFDYARHQREIALAYYQTRGTIGTEAISAMRAHTHHEDEHQWNQPEVPLEATLASAPPKPLISRFKSDRLSGASSLASHSLGTSVLPSAQSSVLKSAIRVGKLEDGRLVGEESEEEAEDELKEMLELLRKGEATNIGPSRTELNTSSAASSSAVPSKVPSVITKNAVPMVDEPSSTHVPLSKVSKFKMSLALNNNAQRPGQNSPNSPLITPPFLGARSSPKSTSPLPGTPIAVPTSLSRPLPSVPSTSGSQRQAVIATAPTHSQMPSMIIESPSFMPPNVNPYPSKSALLDPSPWQSPTIIDSPSFQGPYSAYPSERRTLEGTAKPIMERTPVVMSADVKESAGRRAPIESGKEKRVSRFRAERE